MNNKLKRKYGVRFGFWGSQNQIDSFAGDPNVFKGDRNTFVNIIGRTSKRRKK